jgi:prevent-host-death family protein
MTNTLSISAARASLPTIIDKVAQNLDRYLITVSGQPKAVVLSLEELESLEETAEILAIPGAKAAIQRGLLQAKKRRGLPLAKVIR